MSGYPDQAPRTVSVAPPGFKGKVRHTTPFTRNRAALDRVPQEWGPTVGQAGAAWAPTGALYEPVTHAHPAESHLLGSTPRQVTTRTVHRSRD